MIPLTLGTRQKMKAQPHREGQRMSKYLIGEKEKEKEEEKKKCH